MNLHEHKEEFEELIAIVADHIGIPSEEVIETSKKLTIESTN